MPDHKPSSGKELPPLARAVAVALVAAFVIAVIMLTWVERNPNEVGVYLLGNLTGMVATIVAYYFGSSQGSRDKT